MIWMHVSMGKWGVLVKESPGLSLSDSHIQGSLNKGEVGLKGLGMTLQVHKALLAFLKES